MSDEIETLDLGNGRTAEIVQDSSCSQPFEDDDAVHIVILSRRYRDPSNGACGRTPDEIAAWEKANPDWFTTPLWFFDHSGIAYAAGASNPFSCPWDSGQAGIVALKRSEWGNGNPTDEQLAEYANNVAQEFGQWANGETYGYIVRDSDGNEEDSCFGFVGLDRVKEEVMNEHGPQSMAPAA